MKFFIWLLLCLFCSLSQAQISAQAYVVLDQDGVILFEKNPNEVRSIASITKLFSLSQIVPVSRLINITKDEKDTLKGTRMRLKSGSYNELELIDAALSASNNEAAKSLGKHHNTLYVMAQEKYPDIHIVEPSGLDPNNKSSALALARSALIISKTPIAEHTIKPSMYVGNRSFRNTNPLLRKPGWDFILSKTGFINESGGCLVVVMRIGGKDYSVALLGSSNTRQRWKDLSQLRGIISNEPYFMYNTTKRIRNS